MRAGLYAVYGRWKSIRDDGWITTSLSNAMALEALLALTEAYPDDPHYRSAYNDVVATNGGLA